MTDLASQPLVSIVTPSYNQARFIRATIQSVLDQSYPAIEYWVMDGGSTDGTLNILKEYEGDPRFHWVSEVDRGQADALQKGWDRSTGEILGWLNSDDVYCSDAVKKAVERLKEDPQAAFVYSNYGLIDESGKSLGKIRAGQAGLKDQLLFRCLIPQQTVFVRREVIEKVGGVDIQLHYALDQDLWTRVLESWEGKYVDDLWGMQRIHPDAKTQASWKMLHREFYTVVLRYQGYPKIRPQIWAEALRRAALNLFIAEACDGEIDRATSHLEIAFQEDQSPFRSLSYSIKHVNYNLRHWLTPEEAERVIWKIASISVDNDKSPFAAFPPLLMAYYSFQNEDHETARQYLREASQRYPAIYQDASFWMVRIGSHIHPAITRQLKGLKRRMQRSTGSQE